MTAYDQVTGAVLASTDVDGKTNPNDASTDRCELAELGVDTSGLIPTG